MSTVDSKAIPVRYVRPQTNDGKTLTWESVSKLRVSHESADNPIHLFQVEVYGVDGVNYALREHGGSAQQSTLHGNGRAWGRAECVIDGIRAGPCNHTAHAENGWLEVLLAKPVNVESFAIFNMPDDFHDHRMRAMGHVVELFDGGEVVFRHRISEEDISFFDKAVGCCQKWVNEDSNVVIANLNFSQDANLEEVTVAAVQPSGRELARLSLALAHPEAVPEMCRAISSQSGVDPHRLRLLLPDGRVLRMSAEELQTPSLGDLLPSLRSLSPG
ncbi:unnamed protein product [Effrenium voratum]|nr:unnamed protein product [Effrenium voratum]CAJ1436818.1 unnamed protein product [Effrenium voratum]